MRGLCALGAVVLAGALPAQNVLSINFRGGSGRAVTGTAGLRPAPSWNNAPGGASTSPLALVDDAGNPTSARLLFASASGGFQLGPPATSQDGALFDGQVIAQSGNGAQVTLTSLPFQTYDVHVFVGHGPAHAGQTASVSAGGQTFFFRNEDLSTYRDPVAFRPVTTTSAPGAAGNTVSFRGLTGATLTVGLSYVTGRAGIAGLQVVGGSRDSDNDGLDDAWELRWFGNLNQGPNDDPDNDRLANLGEFRRQTVPIDSDTDDDLSLDGDEVARNTDPLDPDTDDDGLLDGVETATGRFVSRLDTGTQPLVADTDGDRVKDGPEVRRGTDPNNRASVPDLPNVIVVMVDDLGWGELGSYGQALIRTPVLDQMAREGMRFSNFYSGSPVCAPTRCTLVTGKHTGQAFIRDNGGFNGYQRPLPAGTETIGHLMQREGYTTACIGKWGLGGPATSGHPNRMGFDHFFGYLGQVQAHWFYPDHLWRNDQRVLYPNNNGAQGPTNRGADHSQDQMTKEALAFIDANKANPFFLYLAWTIPHVSLQEPPHSDPVKAAQGQTAIDEFYPNVGWAEPNANFPSNHYTSHPRPRRGYAAMITAMDRDLGLIQARLRAHGLDRDTLVVFTSDNGPTTCCGVDTRFFNSAANLRAAKGSVYDGGIRVPMIARWPGRIAAGTVSDHVGAVYDFLPTLGELVDGAVPADVTGISLLPTLLGQPQRQTQHEYLYWEYGAGGQHQRAVRSGDWKGVRIGDASAGARLQLYDLATDPGEARDVAGAFPQVAADLTRIMDSRRFPSPEFFRNRDEFPVMQNVTAAAHALGIRLDSAGQGYCTAPLPRDLTGRFEARWSMQVQRGRAERAAVTFGAGTTTASHLRCELDAAARKLAVVSGARRIEAALGAQDDPYRVYDLELTADTRTGAVALREGARTYVQGTLAGGPGTVSHYGLQVENAVAAFGRVTASFGGSEHGAYTPFGTGCAGALGAPSLRALSGQLPRLGARFTVVVDRVPAGAGTLGVLGFSDARWGSTPLPLDLTLIGMNRCSMLVSPDLFVPLAVQGGRATWVAAIPDDPLFLGVRFFQQALVNDASANPAGATVSNAGAAVVGY